MRGYFVYDRYENQGVAVVANSAKEAKKIGFNSVEAMYGSEWIEVSVKWIKDANVSEIVGSGELSLADGLRRGIFEYVAGVDCEICGKRFTRCKMLNGKIVCTDCKDRETETMLSPTEKEQ